MEFVCHKHFFSFTPLPLVRGLFQRGRTRFSQFSAAKNRTLGPGRLELLHQC